VSQELRITARPYVFRARQEDAARLACKAFLELLPFRNKTIHVRWSGEAVWVPLGNAKIISEYENHITYPSWGDILLYPGGISETEILIAHGSTSFASKMGSLAGNHFLTIVDGMENLAALYHMVLWEGPQDILFEPL
jgi:hypothetical protein